MNHTTPIRPDPAESPVSAKPPESGRTGARAGLAVALLLAAGLGWGFWQNRAAHLAADEASREFLDTAPLVRVAKIAASGDAVVSNLPGATSAYQSADIYARANGYVEKRNVDLGSRVKAGEVMAVLSAPELDHQIAQAKAAQAQAQATVRQSEANEKLAQATNQRSATLVNQGWVTKQQGDNDRLTLDAQQAAYKAALANDAVATAAIKVLQQQRDYLTVTAPFDGVVSQRLIDVGSLVQSQATLMFTLTQTDVIRVQVHVPQDQAYGLKEGVEAIVRVPELPGKTFVGKITRISGALQQGTRTLLVEADVPNPDGELKAGLYCNVELHIPRVAPTMMVPAEAIIFNREGLQVAVVENDVVHLRKINVSRDFGTQVEASAGVKPGDLVVLNPRVDLVDGGKVRVAPEPGKH